MKKNLLAAGLLSMSVTFAAGVGGGAFPWDTGLAALALDLTGPVAIALGTVGAVGALGPAVFHAEIPHLSHKASSWFLAAGGLVGIPKLMALIGIGGAIV